MKTLFTFILFALCVTAQAQVNQSQPIDFKFDHDGIFAARLYRDGAQIKQFAISELTVTTNATGAFYTFKVTLSAGLPRGTQTITARVVDPDGIESDDSNALVLKVKPKAPWGFSLW